jgi:hypothetical protein
MTLYSIVLYLHVLAALGLFATLSFEGWSLFHLRRASTLAEARLWIEPVAVADCSLGIDRPVLGSVLGDANAGVPCSLA